MDNFGGLTRQQRAALTTRRRAFCMRLAAEGMNYEQIAEQVRSGEVARREGFARPSFQRGDAFRDCKHALAEQEKRPARMYVAGQNLDLMRMKRTYRPLANGGDHKAALVMLQLMKREAELNGLDAPKLSKIEISQHLEALAALATRTLRAALDAAPELSNECRQRMLAAVQSELAQIEAGERRAITAASEIVDAEIVSESA